MANAFWLDVLFRANSVCQPAVLLTAREIGWFILKCMWMTYHPF